MRGGLGYHRNIGLKMRFKAADWKCLEEKAQTEQKTLQSLRKKKPSTLLMSYILPISPPYPVLHNWFMFNIYSISYKDK